MMNQENQDKLRQLDDFAYSEMSRPWAWEERRRRVAPDGKPFIIYSQTFKVGTLYATFHLEPRAELEQ